MLNQLENYYWRYNSASQLVNTIFKFIDPRATKFFLRTEYLTLSESMFTSLISRASLSVTECHKFQVMLRWATNRVMGGKRLPPIDSAFDRTDQLPSGKRRELQIIMNRLTRDLKLHKIPPQELITVCRLLLPSVSHFLYLSLSTRLSCRPRRSATSGSWLSCCTKRTLGSTFAPIDPCSEVFPSCLLRRMDVVLAIRATKPHFPVS